ncbi:M15 family metallopeptidase [Pantoea dispersa]|uniref:M15 family metallopeptidase n=1 Tax=Pantoea dispersa TaxID=59814 RepID=UPI0021CA6B3E|nr:M15 family metallopeptidase [Pantoea dispersa]
MYNLSKRSKDNLIGVSPQLIAVVYLSIEISPIDFMVFEGVRTFERQRMLVAKGLSKTLKSKHLTGEAVDLVPLVNGRLTWEDRMAFRLIKDAMFNVASKQNVRIKWGGDWGKFNENENPFYDGAHFEMID